MVLANREDIETTFLGVSGDLHGGIDPLGLAGRVAGGRVARYHTL